MRTESTLGLAGAFLWALRSWAGPGDPDPTFIVPPVAGGFPTTVFALAVQPDGKLLAGGAFIRVDGSPMTLVDTNATSRQRLYRVRVE